MGQRRSTKGCGSRGGVMRQQIGEQRRTNPAEGNSTQRGSGPRDGKDKDLVAGPKASSASRPSGFPKGHASEARPVAALTPLPLAGK